jgi:hypothetical protein
MRIKKILFVVDSTYLKGFEDFKIKIMAEFLEMNDNLLFIKILYELCKNL